MHGTTYQFSNEASLAWDVYCAQPQYVGSSMLLIISKSLRNVQGSLLSVGACPAQQAIGPIVAHLPRPPLHEDMPRRIYLAPTHVQ